MREWRRGVNQSDRSTTTSSHARHYAIGTPLLVPGYYDRDSLRRGPISVSDSACLAEASLSTKLSARRRLVGLSRFELLTPRLSSVCSNQLSYRPPTSRLRRFVAAGLSRRSAAHHHTARRRILSKLDRTCNPFVYQIDLFQAPPPPLRASARDSRKEVIQPQVLLQLPCDDFTPITDHTLGACLPCGLARRLLVQPAFVM